MINRVPGYLPTPIRNGPPSQPMLQELRDAAQKQFADRMRQIEKYIQEHPVTGIGTALSIGILLGWVIKRR